jgi:hypothetical protein
MRYLFTIVFCVCLFGCATSVGNKNSHLDRYGKEIVVGCLVENIVTKQIGVVSSMWDGGCRVYVHAYSRDMFGPSYKIGVYRSFQNNVVKVLQDDKNKELGQNDSTKIQ